MAKYRSHWSDNRNQLGMPSSCPNSEGWILPWVYLYAANLKQAESRVRDFNRLLKPTDTPQPAHCPTALLARWGFMVFPAGPLSDIDPVYLAGPNQPDIKVGSQVIFIGPEYGYRTGGPTIGERGEVIERDGYTSQAVGEPVEEMVTVKFPLDKKATVVALSRLRLEPDKPRQEFHKPAPPPRHKDGCIQFPY